MKLGIGILLGVVITLATLAVIGYATVTSGVLGWRADAAPGELERWAAKSSLRASLRSDSEAKVQSPIPDNEANILMGARLYVANCAFCHGTPSMGIARAGESLYQAAPQFGIGDNVSDDPVGKIHAITAHGIRLTGMPAFGNVLPPDDVWKMVLFLKHQTNLPPAAAEYWKTAKAPVGI